MRFGHIEAAGSVTKALVSNRTGRATRAKEDAIGYATARAKFGRGEIRVLDNTGTVERVIAFDQTGRQ